MTFSYRLAGIPCQIEILQYYYRPARIYGPPEHCYPSEFEFEYIVLDRKGYKADWLARKINDDIEADILATYEELIASYGDDF